LRFVTQVCFGVAQCALRKQSALFFVFDEGAGQLKKCLRTLLAPCLGLDVLAAAGESFGFVSAAGRRVA
jgi:hypothetical protein